MLRNNLKHLIHKLDKKFRSPVETPLALQEEVHLTGEELMEVAINAALNVRKALEVWNTEPEVLRAIAKLLPKDENLVEPHVLADILVCIQRDFLVDRFYDKFEDTLYEYKRDVSALPLKEYSLFQMRTSVLRTQLVQLLAVATQGLIKQAKAAYPPASRVNLPEEKVPKTNSPMEGNPLNALWYPKVEDNQ